jgi:hypothetical protein
MTTDTHSPIETAYVSRLIEDLSARIARLPIGLRILLDTDADIQQAIHALAEASTPDIERRTTEHISVSPERRISRQRSELRGLLVMRFEAETKMVGLVGGATSRLVLSSVTHSMESHGFKPGAGGSTVNRRASS